MTHRLVFIFIVGLLVGCADHAPYAGQETRTLKALSSDDIQGYLSGSGMGFAKAAELNHYPGPRHVLELADELQLTADQQSFVDSSFHAMKRDAVDLGTRLVRDEEKLDSLFSHEVATPETVDALVRSIGSLQSELRYVHLRAHLDLKHVLTADQRAAYDELRGYGKAEQDHSGHKM